MVLTSFETLHHLVIHKNPRKSWNPFVFQETLLIVKFYRFFEERWFVYIGVTRFKWIVGWTKGMTWNGNVRTWTWTWNVKLSPQTKKIDLKFDNCNGSIFCCKGDYKQCIKTLVATVDKEDTKTLVMRFVDWWSSTWNIELKVWCIKQHVRCKPSFNFDKLNRHKMKKKRWKDSTWAHWPNDVENYNLYFNKSLKKVMPYILVMPWATFK